MNTERETRLMELVENLCTDARQLQIYFEDAAPGLVLPDHIEKAVEDLDVTVEHAREMLEEISEEA